MKFSKNLLEKKKYFNKTTYKNQIVVKKIQVHNKKDKK